MSTLNTAPLLEMRNIEKSFPGVRALGGVNLTLKRGEVHALVGENGAGKSTLMRILAGAMRADRGNILIDGEPVTINTPKAAELLGIGMIAQEFNLVPTLGVIENIVLGIEPTRGIFLDERSASELAASTLGQLGITIPIGGTAAKLTVAQQQLVEIAKALARRARIIVMDEPTAALSEREIHRLFALIDRLRKEGVAFMYISHRMEELPRIADRATVLRDGVSILTKPLAEFPREEIIAAMVGRDITTQFPTLPDVDDAAPTILRVAHLKNANVHDVSFEVRRGELLGIAGLVGAGRTEILRAIAGADSAQGTVMINDVPVTLGSPCNGIAAGIAFITEDRKGQGLILDMNVRENTTLAHLKQFSRGVFIDTAAEESETLRFIHELRIRTPNSAQRVRNLSGGNQQKVVLAKWLVGQAQVFLFDEPTRGIDIGAKMEIYELLLALLREGAAIVLISSELPEVLGMSHRVIVVRDGRIAAEFSREHLQAQAVIAAATGAV